MYVAISGRFTEDVRNNLRRMRRRESDQVPSMDYKLSSTRPDVVNWAWGEHLHLKAQMPASWCGKLSDTAIRFDTSERGTFRINVTLVPTLVVPPGRSPQGSVTIAPTDEEIKPYVEREAQLYDINERWDKVDKQLLEFLKKCKSVNEALKLWPQIEMYIPSDYIARVNEKKERSAHGPSEAAEALKSMDTDHLTTAAVIARMSGGKE